MTNITYNHQTGQTDERPMTAEEEAERLADATAGAWDMIRHKRNGLLAASDWTVLSDSPTSTAAWKTYRQALRDLPANTTDPFNPDWPVPPA